MTKKYALIGSLLLLTLGHTAHANVDVNFLEGAPKDRFVISNTGSCNLENAVLKIDLANTAGRLIFDTTSTGAGVEVFQPFEVTKGAITVSSPEGVKDGDNLLSINIASLNAGQSASFTIDVDDTLPKSVRGNIIVAGSEIKDGSVSITTKGNSTASALFSGASKATLVLPNC